MTDKTKTAHKPHGNARGQITGDMDWGSFPVGGPQPIPDDVMKAADAAEAQYSGTNVDVIARAIMAERERCASIAESHIDGTDYDLEPEAAVAESVTAKAIAAAIRKGEA